MCRFLFLLQLVSVAFASNSLQCNRITLVWSDGICNHADWNGHFHLEYTIYDDGGNILSSERVRKDQDAFMIGYVSAKMNKDTIDVVFASQDQHDGIVDRDVKILTSRFNKEQSEPLAFLLNDTSELLSPCARNVSKMGIGPCVDVDTFSPRWFGDDVIFGYRTLIRYIKIVTVINILTIRIIPPRHMVSRWASSRYAVFS